MKKVEGSENISLPSGALFNATHIRLSLVEFPPQDIPTPFHRAIVARAHRDLVFINPFDLVDGHHMRLASIQLLFFGMMVARWFGPRGTEQFKK